MLLSTFRVINQVIRGYLLPPKLNPNKSVDVGFRCWPIDLDSFIHMNNSKYLQVAELTRWRTIVPILPYILSKGLLLLVAENNIQYMRPIIPFQRYIVSTSVSVDEKEDKWIYYKHVFEEHPEDFRKRNSSTQPQTYAVVQMKGIVKELNGKTVKPSTLINKSTFFKEWFLMK